MQLGPFLLAAAAAASPLLARAATPVPTTASRQLATVEADARRALSGAGPALVAGRDGLRVEATFATPDGGHVVRLRQLYRGLPVLEGVVVVRLDAAGHALRVANGAKALSEVALEPHLTAADAVRVARGALTGVPLPLREEGDTALVVAPGAGGRLAWLVDVTTLVPVVAPTAVVDARTGELLSLVDRARTAAAASLARVFPDGPSARAARRADGTFDGTGLASVSLAGLTSSATGSHLTGHDIVVTNCCPNEGCDPAREPKKTDAKLSFDVPPNNFIPGGKLEVTVHAVLCDELPVATADASGSYLYDPATEPTSDQAPVPGPSEGDAFSEVMLYQYAQSELDFVRTLDPQFQLGPDARPLHATANFLVPDLNDAQDQQLNPIMQVLQTRTATISHLARFDNAAWVPRGQASRLGAMIPGFGHDYDSLIVGQGPTADYGYDADVVSHEFGHGVVEVSAGLADYAADDWGVLDAPGALNEGFADLFAALRENDPHIGEYVGGFSQAGEGALRDLTNDFNCPAVLSGEVHQDSQHFSAAVWAARGAVAGTVAADRLRFDRAMLAALRSLKPDSTFDEAGQALSAEVGLAFDGAAKASVDAALASRKVVGCERLVTLEPGTPRTGYVLAPALKERGFTPYAPGPVQFALQLPPGTTTLRLAATGATGGLGGVALPGLGGAGGGGPVLQALLRPDERIHFSYGAAGVASDAQKNLPFTGVRNQEPSVTLPVEPGCAAKAWFLAVGNAGQAPFNLDALTVEYTVDAAKVKACSASAPDGGRPADTGAGGDAKAGGCNCASGGELALAPALLGTLATLRRRRARRG